MHDDITTDILHGLTLLRTQKKPKQCWTLIYGGEAGIRTLGRDKPSTVFKTAAFGHSATSPGCHLILNAEILPNI